MKHLAQVDAKVGVDVDNKHCSWYECGHVLQYNKLQPGRYEFSSQEKTATLSFSALHSIVNSKGVDSVI